ncbi:MAG: trimethylamine methyltransferase family protein [Candidatus Methanomethylicia archaeon]
MRIRILNRGDICRIDVATMEVLEKIGIKIFEDEALRIMRRIGVEVGDNKTVRIPEYIVREAIKKAPSSFILFGRKHRLKIEPGNTYFSMQGTSIHILDLETGLRREPTLRDLENFCRLADALENIHHVSIAVEPKDVKIELLHVYELLTMFRNTTKTIDGNTYGGRTAMDTVRLTSIVAGGIEELMKKPMLLGFHNPVSPLQHSKELTEGLIVYAKYRQPVIIAPEAQAGATAPATLAGLLVQQNAEVLSGLVIAEFTNPGTPILYGTVSAPLDMRTGNIALGAIETGLINAATAEIASYYNLPSRGTGGVTDSKIPDIQAGIEKALTLLMAAMAGINFIYDASGSLESTLTASYEQAVIDNEICGMVNRALCGIEVNDETLALDVISEVGSGGHYLSKKHTIKYLKREYYIPKIIDRDRREKWIRMGGRDLWRTAREEAMRILAEHRPEPLDKDVENELVKLVGEMEKKLTRNH